MGGCGSSEDEALAAKFNELQTNHNKLQQRFNDIVDQIDSKDADADIAEDRVIWNDDLIRQARQKKKHKSKLFKVNIKNNTSPSVNISVLPVSISDIIENLKQAQILIPEFKGMVVTPKSHDYNKIKYQYATSSYPVEQMSPSMICYPIDVDDIKIILQYAPTNNKNLIIRSGGCQYSGLSSGNENDIIIDMQSFNKLEVRDINKLSIGPCLRLGHVAPFLNDNKIAIPMGDCECVNIGGHVQSGGYGNILRGFGLCLDFIHSFDLLTANGQLLHIVKPGTDDDANDDEKGAERYEDNDDLYWAVLGGNPGSFGIITQWNFNCIKDDEHPNSAGIQCYFLFTHKVMKNLLTEFAKLVKEADTGKLPPDYDFMFTIAAMRDLPFVGAIVFEGAYSNVKGEEEDFNPEYFNRIIKAAGVDPHVVHFAGKMPVSEMMVRFVKHINREYELPYKKTLRGTTECFSDEFPESYAKKATELLELTGFGDGFKFISQVQMGGGAYFTNDPESKLTSISHRNCKIGMTFDIFYNTVWNTKAEEKAQHFQDKCKKEWIDDGLFSPNKKDIRFTWGTFGDTNIENVWQYYYDSEEKYNKLRRIKTKIDPNNVFSNRFTLPLLES